MAPEYVVGEVIQTLAGPRHTYDAAVDLVPAKPGLYAFFGNAVAWRNLGLTAFSEHVPLYVGKAEKSLNGRDVSTHFAAGKTGSSTLRRSLAALLARQLGLVAVPRNLAKPHRSAQFGLDQASEVRLSQWMQQHLLLATWSSSGNYPLAEVESAVLLRLRPPLNLQGIAEPRLQLRAARRQLADQARAWIPALTSPVEEILPFSDELAVRFEDYEPDPSGELDPTAVAALQAAVLECSAAERHLVDAVRRARSARLSWSAIGVVIGTSGKAARQRYPDEVT